MVAGSPVGGADCVGGGGGGGGEGGIGVVLGGGRGGVIAYTLGRCVFFFQAEDGIRDLTVTGVQTCALPISGAAARGVHAGRRTLPADGAGGPLGGAGDVRRPRARGDLGAGPAQRRHQRSEERRVGKECRSRWSPYH